MSDFQTINTTIEKEQNKYSLGPGYYTTNTIQTENKPVFPWAPTVRLQKIGGSLLKDVNTIDVDSELFRIKPSQFKRSKYAL